MQGPPLPPLYLLVEAVDVVEAVLLGVQSNAAGEFSHDLWVALQGDPFLGHCLLVGVVVCDQKEQEGEGNSNLISVICRGLRLSWWPLGVPL